MSELKLHDEDENIEFNFVTDTFTYEQFINNNKHGGSLIMCMKYKSTHSFQWSIIQSIINSNQSWSQ